MLAIIGIILIILWALGLGFHIAGSLIHIILVVAVIDYGGSGANPLKPGNKPGWG
jgi:hypothetical protein